MNSRIILILLGYAGICLNAGLYAMHNNIDKDTFINLLKQEFTKDNLDNQFPFNNDHNHYMMEGSDKFQNKKRLEWLKKKSKYLNLSTLNDGENICLLVLFC